MDWTLLSKIELGHRLPTEKQARLLARHFGVPVGEIEGRRIMEKFWRENGENPAMGEAVQRIQETAPAYVVNESVNQGGTAAHIREAPGQGWGQVVPELFEQIQV